MTIDTGGAAPEGRGRLERLVRRARLVLLWENVWPPIAALLGVVLVFLTLSWFGLWDAVSPLWRIVGVCLFALAFAAALFPFFRLAMPARAGALQRIDRTTGQAHRPATTLDDRLAVAGEDPFTRALWQAHQQRAEAASRSFRVGIPSPRLALRDPRAFRFLLVLVAVVAFFVAGGDRSGRIMAAFDWRTPPAEVVPPRLDAWVAPPAYTGRAPIFLTGAAAGEERQRVIQVPVGSVVVLRASGGEVKVAPSGDARAVETEGRTSAGSKESRYVLDGDSTIEVTAPGFDTRTFVFATIPDTPPTISLSAPPATGPRNTFGLAYRVADDYGVVGAEAQFARRDDPNAKAKPGRPLYDPPRAPLTLPQARTRSGEATTSVDLVEHPWAGATVTLTLVARDEAGQVGRSEPQAFTLPARPFSDPVARALVEQRRNLALDVGARGKVSKALDALAMFPEKFTPDTSIYLGLRTAYWRLDNAETDEDLKGVADYLWQMALAIEEGDLTDAERALRAAERALQDALDRGASDEEIRRLTQELRQAMNEFLRELARRAPEAEQNARAPNANERMLRPQDLQNMLDRLEEMARRGDRQAAKDLLAELRQTLQNLRNARRMQRNPRSEQMGKMLDELGDMIREQNRLRDQTFQKGRQGRQGQQQQGQRRPGQRGQQGQQGQQGEQGEEGMGDLAEAQRQLRQRLEQLRKQMEQMGGQGDPNLGEAGDAMQGAEGSLGEGDSGSAVDQQGKALDALRRGAQSMASRMMGEGEGEEGEPGDGAPSARRGPGGEEDTDPLGRPTRSRTYESGNSVKVPGEIDAQRARRVLEDIRRRLSEPDRPREELDYLERLLEQ